MRARTLILALSGTLLGTTAAAEVRTPAASIVWEAPAECPNEFELVRQVEALLGDVLQQAKPQPLRFVARVHVGSDAGYRLLLRVAGGSEELTRELTHPSCDKLTEAASLVIALAIDQERVQATQLQRDTGEIAPGGEGVAGGAAVNTRASAPAPAVVPQGGAPVPQAEAPAPVALSPSSNRAPLSAGPPLQGVSPMAPEPPTRDASSPAVETAYSRHRRVQLMLSGGAVAGAGVLPNTAFGAELGFGATLGAAGSLGAFAELWAPSEEAIAGVSGATLRMRQVTLGVRGCWLPELVGLRGVGCLAGEVARLSGEGQDVSGAREDSAVWGGIRAELGVLLPLRTGSYLTAGGAGGLSLRRPRFGLASEDGAEIDVFQPSAWYVRGKVGALFTFE